MATDDNFLQMTAIKSLKKISTINSAQNEIVKFFDVEADERAQLVINTLHELLNKKFLKFEIITLLQNILSIDSTGLVMSDDLKSEIYSNLFGGVKKLLAPVVELIVELEDDFWMTVVNLLDSSETSVNLESFISSAIAIEGAELNDEKILELMGKTKENSSKQAIVAALYSDYLKINPESIGRVDDALSHCSSNETAFAYILEGIIRGGRSTIFSDILVNNIEKVTLIFECLMKLFERIDNVLILSSIMEVFRILSKMSPEYVQQQCRISIQNCITEITEKCQSKSDALDSVKHLSILTENHTMNLLSPIDIVRMRNIFEILLENSIQLPNYENNLPYYIRCYVNYVKSLRTKLILGHSIGINVDQLALDIKGFMDEVKRKCLTDKMTLKVAFLELTSYFDLLSKFQIIFS
jgi:hypothetical protein